MFNDFDDCLHLNTHRILHHVCTGTSKKIKIDSQTDGNMENVGQLSTHLHDIDHKIQMCL